MLLKPTADVATEEEIEGRIDELFELDESEDLGLRYPDGRHHIYDEALNGRRFVMMKKGYSVERGPEII